MAFTYRLSRRLAQIHIAMAVAFSAACTDMQDPSSTPSDVRGVSSDNVDLGGPSFLTALQAVSSGAGACRNEPTGYNGLTDQPFNILPAAYPYFDALGWQRLNQPARFSLVNDASSPSRGSVIKGRYPQGQKGGTAPFRMDRPLKGKYKSVYMCLSTKVSSNFTTNGNTGIKFSFLETPYDWSKVQGINHYVNLYPALGVNLQYKDPKMNRNMYSTFKLSAHRNEWHTIEVLVIGNSLGKKDGIARMWVDGAQVLSQSNVQYFYSGQAPQFTRVTWNPTYGGGTNPIPYNMDQWIDGWYISVK